MTTPYVAPYGGLLTKTLDEEKEREEKLQLQQINVAVNNLTETLRPESIMVRGVDNLSSEDIKAFVDYHLNFETKTTTAEDGSELVDYIPKPIDDQITFRIQWINDAAVNIVFKSHEDAYKALSSISITSSNPNIVPSSQLQQDSIELTEEHVADIIQERETKPYSPTIQFRHKQNLLNRLAIVDQPNPPEEDQEEKMIEDDSAIVLYTRQSFQSDRKVKNASVYSRYYLLHGEPERRPRYNQNDKRHRNGRGGARHGSRDDRHNGRHTRETEEEEEDLFASRLKQNGNHTGGRLRSRHHDNYDEEEDLFASKLKMRERSPTRNRSRSPMRD